MSPDKETSNAAEHDAIAEQTASPQVQNSAAENVADAGFVAADKEHDFRDIFINSLADKEQPQEKTIEDSLKITPESTVDSADMLAAPVKKTQSDKAAQKVKASKTENIFLPEQDSAEGRFITAGMKRIFAVLGVALALTVILASIVALINASHGDNKSSSAAGVAESGESSNAEPNFVSIEPEKEPLSDTEEMLAAQEGYEKIQQTMPGARKTEAFTALEADTEWLVETAGKTNIPTAALRAYANAALTLNREMPSCGIGWNTLAAIGQVESQHGSLNNATLGADGRALPRIIGVALDGNGYAATADTDDGVYDNDTTWDHAVGPMQFIPETWGEYFRDATGDGWADIDDINDQALTAATLLCEVGTDLTISDNWIAAIAAYNPSVAYNNDVANIAEQYARLVRD